MSGSQPYSSYCLRWRRATLLLLAVFLGACAADPPVIPPTPLTSVQRSISPKTLWKVKVGQKDQSLVNSFTPWTDENAVFSASSDGTVVSLDANTGKILWRRDLDRELVSGVGGDDIQVYVAGRDGQVIALSRDSGESSWEYSMSSEVLVPVSTSASGVVIVRAADGRVSALNSSNGKENWSNTFEPPALTVNGYSQPLVLENGVLVGLDDGKLAALSLERGQLLWQSAISYPKGRSEIERLVDVDSNVLIDDSFIYAVSYQGKLARLEPGRGGVEWAADFSTTVGMTQSEQRLFLTDADSRVVAVDKNSGEVLWTQEKLLGRLLTRPVLAGSSALAVADLEGFLHLLARDSGELIGRIQPLETRTRGAPVAVGDKLYIQSADARLVAVRIPQ